VFDAYLVKDNNVANYIEISFDIYPYNLTSYNRILKLDEKIIRSFLIKK
jgi:ribosomal protein S6